ncbi:DUF2207 domain-containing protein [Pseudomonas sp. BMS12]|uniref:DUF2207 domain-containing protein n=1 Tax=Pseudomonas sp. BMS12 TaxID=1796033 RepID=UPI00083A5EF4|nr:DUF2207 domain-containing protein [Pseudomonas sp. BMS12]
MPGRLLSLLLLCCLASSASADEVIESFAATLQVQADGQLLVTERIVVQAEGGQIRRGIYRELPTRYRRGDSLYRNTPFEWLGSSRDGQPEASHIVRAAGGERLYLGSAEHILEPGRHSYELRYRVDAQLIQGELHDELYWNVTGNAWRLPILSASAEVLLPEGAQIVSARAYTGLKGTQGTDYRIESGQGRLALTSTRVLGPGEGLTLAVQWPSGLVTHPGWLKRTWRLLCDNLGLLRAGLAVLFLAGVYGYYWYRIGRDPAPGLVIPRYAAPEGVSPARVSFLWHRGFAEGKRAVRELGVTLTDLAIRGHVHLRDEGGRLLLTRATECQATLGIDEGRLLDELFTDGQPIPLGRTHQPRLLQAVVAFGHRLKEFGARYHSLNRAPWLVGFWIAFAATLVLLFAESEGEASKEIAGIAVSILLFGGIGIGSLLSGGPSFGGIMALLVSLFPLSMLANRVPPGALVAVTVLWLLVVLFRFLLAAPTVQGRRMLDELAGYREYLQLAEADVLARAGDAPAMSIELYERHLPYAMALGVEARWSARFAAALAAGLVEPQLREYRPDWSVGRDAAAIGRELAPSLYRDLASACDEESAASSSADYSVSDAPSSSGGSASSGGGHSGGGAGGGGGGGW